MKYDRVFKWDLTKEQVENILGKEITYKEFFAFCKCFSDYFKIEYYNTLEWVGEEWEKELKEEYI